MAAILGSASARHVSSALAIRARATTCTLTVTRKKLGPTKTLA